MKIVCEACGAKYSIADDRVAGKVFKIRCKRCSEVIVVRGDQPEAAAPAQAASAAYDDQSAIWHVVVDGEQAGPYAPTQLGEMLSAGTVDWEAYVWTEGFDNWVPMRDVADLVAQITGQDGGQPAASAAAEPAYRAAAASTATLTGQPSMGADPFADDRDGGGFGGGGQQSVAGPDLFGASQDIASPFSSSRQDAVVASAPSPRVSREQVMTGARNENSVLFSLKNLQALATGSPSVPPQNSSGQQHGGGFAGGEGSGLIDIRALATTTGVGGAEGGGARDELLSMGAQGGAFGALGSPMLGATAGDDDGNKKAYVWAGVAAVGLVAMAVVAIAYILFRPAVAPPSVVVNPVPAVVAATPTAPSAAAPTAAPTEGELAAAERARKEEPESSRSGGSSRGEGSRRRDGDKDKPGESAPAAGPAAAAGPEAPSKPSKPSGPRSIDDLLGEALAGPGKGGKPAEAAPASSADLPKSPSRDQVKSAMASVKDAVNACNKGGPGGLAIVEVSVAGATGRVTNAQVKGVTGPLGSCVAQAVRRAQFPKFQSGVFKVAYPFKLE
jgi:predicted Zn finger-like uncharacterized protein